LLRDDGFGIAIDDWAKDIVKLAETYTEVSPSGRGLRLIWRGKIDKTFKCDPMNVEVYKNKRYPTITGKHLAGTPNEIKAAPGTEAALRARVDSYKAEQRSEVEAPPPRKGGVISAAMAQMAGGSGIGGGGSNFFRSVNTAALERLDSWVPRLLPKAVYQPGTGACRVSSRDLGRQLQEDLSIAPNGIVDFGVADVGDPKLGKRTPIDLVLEFGGKRDAAEAALWLCECLGLKPAELGWRDNPKRAIAHTNDVTAKLAVASKAPQWRDTSASALDWRERKQNGAPVPSLHNARLAIVGLGIECRHDTFHNKMLFGFKDDDARHALEHIVGSEVTDNGVVALRQRMSDRYGFDLTEKHTRDAVISLALEHCFDPVLDMLAQAEANWDRVERLDRMAMDYFNCEDTKLNAAFIRKMMIAAVARARNPGCKFDNILVLESEEGLNKSTAIRVLAGDDNFSDECIIGKDSKEVQEQLEGVWLHENAELAGMARKEVEKVKNYASKQVDRARPAYGRFNKRQPRRSVEFGTTNSSEYLQSQTGNRRFWPTRILKSIDIDKLKRDRLQLWGEAAHYQSQGESLVLDEALWAEAGEQQEARRITDPWEDKLSDMPKIVELSYFKDGFWRNREVRIVHREGDEDKIEAAELLEHVLKISPGSQTTAHTMRLSTVMRKLGWERNGNGRVSIGGNRVKGYFRRP
jgi:predicted P-loop ATPase